MSYVRTVSFISGLMDNKRSLYSDIPNATAGHVHVRQSTGINAVVLQLLVDATGVQLKLTRTSAKDTGMDHTTTRSSNANEGVSALASVSASTIQPQTVHAG